MKDIILKKIVCILVAVTFLLPLNTLTADNPKGGGGSTTDINAYTWREAESWDRSYNDPSGVDWKFYSDNDCSNNNFTSPYLFDTYDDYIEFDFYVFLDGIYHFWVRGHQIPVSGCENVSIHWNGDEIGWADWKESPDSWVWSNIGSTNLSVGFGTLKIKHNKIGGGFIEVDNILITNNESYEPSGKEVEGSNNHNIGAPCLDFGYIKDITKELSQIIKEEYDPGELAKGRAFGTIGERYAADFIKDEMDDLDLYNVEKEQIDNSDDSLNHQLDNHTDKLEVLEKGFVIDDGISETPVLDCYISPRWNLSTLGYNFSKEDIICPFWKDLLWNRSKLTHNFSYANLEVEPKKFENIYWFTEFICDHFVYFLDDIDSFNWSSFMDLLITEFENYNTFSFEDLTPENAATELDWWAENYSEYSGERGAYVFIAENPYFNPNPITPGWYECVTGRWIEGLEKAQDVLEMLIWKMTLPKCKGLILYDFHSDKDVFDMNLDYVKALPTLYIINSTGYPIHEYHEDYNIDFYINQSWNKSVESYNVIGQINGTDPDKTIIVGCLYDGWWNQGTADSAIGMATVLALAKYYKDYNITPLYNMKFIGFGGEEYGLRGAYHYEIENRDENITTIIDLNQLGFYQTDPRLTLNVIINNESVNSTIKDITDRTNYEDRLQDTTDFRIINTTVWDPYSDYYPFMVAENKSLRTCNTICFLKDRGAEPNDRWTLHHRGNLTHNDGDVIDYYHTNDLVTTAEMILNVTKYYTAQSINIPLKPGWNCISTKTNDPIFTIDLAVLYNGNNYNWSDAVENGYVESSIFWWNTSGPWYTSMSGDNIKLQPGFGYWIYSYKICELLVYSNIHDFNPIAYLDDRGWNCFGLPGKIPVNLSSITIIYNDTNYNWSDAVTEELVESAIFWWNTSGPWYNSIQYRDSNELLETEYGYWIYSNVSSCALLYGESQRGGEKDGGGKGKKDWEVQLNFNEPGDAVTNNVFFGENTLANDGPPHDEYDLLMPPQGPITPYIRAWFDDNLSTPYDTMMKDIRYGPVKSKTWNLTILWYNTTNTTINISWDPDLLKNSEYDTVELYDVSEEEKVSDMLKDSYYVFNATAYYPKSFEIRCSAE